MVFEPRSAIAVVLGGGTSNDLAAATLTAEGVFMPKAAGEHRGESPDLPIQRPLCTQQHWIPEPHPREARNGRLVRHRHLGLGVDVRRRCCHPTIMAPKPPVLPSPNWWFTPRVHAAVLEKLGQPTEAKGAHCDGHAAWPRLTVSPPWPNAALERSANRHLRSIR